MSSSPASPYRAVLTGGTPSIPILGKPCPTYQLCGYTGLLIGFAQSAILVDRVSLDQLILLGITGVVILTFCLLVLATKILVGREVLIYYRQEIAVVAGTALFLRLLHQPVLPYLDITVLGIGMFLVCGRIGCLLVGCCHGRPFRWGICYGEAHAAAGFTPYYVGVPLFPVQALESLWALVIVAVGVSMILRGSPPGSALTWYIIGYGLGRFGFEFLRGDPDRPYFIGFSEAQWTSLILISLTVGTEIRGALPLRPWHIASIAFVILTMAALTVHRQVRRIPTYRLLHPRHIREIADALEFARSKPLAVPQTSPQIYVGCTSLGIQISGSEVELQDCRVPHYTISRGRQPLTADVAKALGVIICRLRHSDCDFDLIPGGQTVFHLLIRAETRLGNNYERSQDRVVH